MSQVWTIAELTARYGRERDRLLDILRAVQAEHGFISDESVREIAHALGIRRVEVHDAATFYNFLSRKPKGRTIVRLAKGVVERQHGLAEVAAAFEQAVGVRVGETTADGAISLEYTSCIGMSDQPPSALVDGQVVGSIRPEEVPAMVAEIREHGHLARSRVDTNLVVSGACIFAPMEKGRAVRSAVNMTPGQVIAELNRARLRGRGGAGFPTAMKWDFCRKAHGRAHYIVCNADEGEPGTFKDRVIFTLAPDLVIEGMTVAAYAIGASFGLLYLRGEYAFLQERIDEALARRRHQGLLGDHICGKEGFDFDIRVQVGAGAYVCGEESSLLESAEGKRGAPRDRPPFPVTRGYLGQPTAVNNAETLCCAARVLEKGAGWFSGIGTKDSTGTKLFSVSGDCTAPGVYELPLGTSVNQLLEMVGAEDVQAVHVGGPSGACVAPKDFGRRLCFEDLATGGSVMVFGKDRDLLQAVRDFTEFFVEESCGWCAPCRAGTALLLHMVERVLEGRASAADLRQMEDLAATVRHCSRCGLGQTAPNPFVTTLRNFPELYQARLSPEEYVPVLRLEEALAAGERAAGRRAAAREASE
jgi:[NiFe] hydrogenase diaphorase moiety large subunit